MLHHWEHLLRLKRALCFHEVDILCLTEHWKSESDLSACILNGYKLASSCCRNKGQHGGYAIFPSKSMQFMDRLDVRLHKKVGSFE